MHTSDWCLFFLEYQWGSTSWACMLETDRLEEGSWIGVELLDKRPWKSWIFRASDAGTVYHQEEKSGGNLWCLISVCVCENRTLSDLCHLAVYSHIPRSTHRICLAIILTFFTSVHFLYLLMCVCCQLNSFWRFTAAAYLRGITVNKKKGKSIPVLCMVSKDDAGPG